MQAWPVSLPDPKTMDNKATCGQSAEEDQIQPYRTRTYPELDARASFDFTQTQFEAFKSWFGTDLNGGCEPWTADWVSDAGFTHHYARFRGGLYSASRKGIRWDVVMELEIMADLVGSAYYVVDPYNPKLYGNLEMPTITLSAAAG